MKSKFAAKVIFMASFITFVFPNVAFAYLDPGTGSYILQIVIGAIVGIAFSIKLYWKKISLLLTNFLVKNKKLK